MVAALFGIMVWLAPPVFDPAREVTTTLDPIHTLYDWDEAVVSWNIAGAERAFLKVEVQAKFEDRETPWLTLAEWSGDLHTGPRRSVKNPKDPDAEVQTDTLHLNRLCRELHVRYTTRQTAPGPAPVGKMASISFAVNFETPKIDVKNEAWGKTLTVPERSQMPYEKGALRYDPKKVSRTFETWFKDTKSDQYCSPTATSMVLSYWAEVLKRPELNVDVPEVVAGVFDEQYPGTGNWTFNTAYAGSFDGIEAFVTRMLGLGEAEGSIIKGQPLICSVSYNLLQGNGKKPGGDGHLVVLIGFTDTGDPIFNDPGRTDVRQTYKRENFRKAWDYSRRTAYVIRPQS